jgi:hypothetical protein
MRSETRPASFMMFRELQTGTPAYKMHPEFVQMQRQLLHYAGSFVDSV